MVGHSYIEPDSWRETLAAEAAARREVTYVKLRQPASLDFTNEVEDGELAVIQAEINKQAADAEAQARAERRATRAWIDAPAS